MITKIEMQKKNKERYNIYIDKGAGEEYGFSVDEHTLIHHGLRKGLEIDEIELTNILYDEEVRKGYLLAISYLSFQMRTRKEIQEYLKKKEIGNQVISEVIDKLSEQSYINEREYACAYVRTQSNVPMKGPDLIRRELVEKGISISMIIESLHEYPEEKQIENAERLCQKKVNSYKHLSALKVRQKLEEMLTRKGYPRHIISIGLESIETKKDSDEEWQALVHHGMKYHEKYKKLEGWAYESKMKQALYRKGFALEAIERFLSEQQN
nr:recombination regulator RecX [Bacillus sp. 165]